MPISVLCPGCQTRFNVSEKFAGKQGPCPKCKKVITVPAAAAEDVKIHVPEAFSTGGRDSKGRPVLKPIARLQTKLTPVAIVATVGTALLMVAVAFMLRMAPQEQKPLLAAVGLAIASPVIALAGYSFLKDDEGDFYKGNALYIRCALCGLAYALLWGLYWPLPTYGIVTGEVWQWLFVIPVFVAAGAGIGFAVLDLDFGSAATHYCFYLLVTLLLRFAMGMPALWDLTTGSSGGAPVVPF